MEMKYKIVYANRKTVSMKIGANGEILVRAPYFTPKSEIERIIKKHSARLEQMREYALKKEKALADVDQMELEETLRAIVMPLVEKYGTVMGQAPQQVKFTNAKKRFGSCNSKMTLCFSRFLALYPSEAIEYVVVHEMAHLFEMNHSPRFYDIVEKYLPDWKERKKLLTLK